MASVKSDIDVNAFPPVDEVCSNSDVVAAAQKNGYEEFPWSDLGLSNVCLVRSVTVQVPGVGKRQVWVFDIHPLFDIIYQQPETLPPEFEAQLASAPVKQQAEKGIAMSEITKEQTFFSIFFADSWRIFISGRRSWIRVIANS